MSYIYDISTLRVKDLTFFLLTWRKWLAPNNASRQQMGFNSGFKGLMSGEDFYRIEPAKYVLMPTILVKCITVRKRLLLPRICHVDTLWPLGNATVAVKVLEAFSIASVESVGPQHAPVQWTLA